MNNLDLQYQNLLRDILESGVEKDTRNGKTLSVFGRQIRHRMSDGYPLLTTKKMAFQTMKNELQWFLQGGVNIIDLIEKGCNIWNGDAYSSYEKRWDTETFDDKLSYEEFIQKMKEDKPFASKWGNLGPIYGYQWRNWNNIGSNGDQIGNLLLELKDNPYSRRHLVTAWNVEQLDEMTLPPCHFSFQVYVRELSLTERLKIYEEKFGSNSNHYQLWEDVKKYTSDKELSLMWNQRSVDAFLGLPFNIASYGLLLLLLCKETGYEAGELIGSLGDTHLYEYHIEQAKSQIQRNPYDLPNIDIITSDIVRGEFECELVNYQSHASIKAPLLT